MSIQWPIPPETVDEIAILLGYDPELVLEMRLRPHVDRIDVIHLNPDSGGRMRYMHRIEEPDDDPGSS